MSFCLNRKFMKADKSFLTSWIPEPHWTGTLSCAIMFAIGMVSDHRGLADCKSSLIKNV